MGTPTIILRYYSRFIPGNQDDKSKTVQATLAGKRAVPLLLKATEKGPADHQNQQGLFCLLIYTRHGMVDVYITVGIAVFPISKSAGRPPVQLHTARNNQPRLSVAHSVQQQPFAIARNGRGKPPAVGVKPFPAIRSVNAGKVRGAQRIQRNS